MASHPEESGLPVHLSDNLKPRNCRQRTELCQRMCCICCWELPNGLSNGRGGSLNNTNLTHVFMFLSRTRQTTAFNFFHFYRWHSRINFSKYASRLDVVRTWTRPISTLLPTQEKHKHRKDGNMYWFLEWDSNPLFHCSKTVRTLSRVKQETRQAVTENTPSHPLHWPIS
jgi:hypothetical protein